MKKNDHHKQSKLQEPAYVHSEQEFLPIVSDGFIAYFHENLLKSFEVVDNKLFNMAENSRSNDDQNLYFSSINIIRKNKEQFLKDFSLALKSVFKAFSQHQFSYAKSLSIYHKKTTSLELVDENVLDESLMITSLISKSDTAYQKQLYVLQKRLGYLVSSDSITSKQLPLSPFVVVNIYAKCLNAFNLNSNVKLIVFKLFERTVMGNLNTCFSKINGFLIENNILPTISYSINKPKKELNKTINKAISKDCQVNKNSRKEINHSANFEYVRNLNSQNSQVNNTLKSNHDTSEQSLDGNYESIVQILKQSRRHSSQYNVCDNSVRSSGYGESANNSINGADYFSQHLSDLQKQIMSQKELTEKFLISPVEISANILDYKKSLKPGMKISQKNEDTIDLIGLLFQFIIDNSNLPNEIQTILSKLQIPFLKIALKDGNLFANKNHEARVLLNSLAKETMGWSEETDPKGDILSKVTEITRHILDVEYLSPKVFGILQMNFDNFIKKVKKKSTITQDRTKKVALAQEKILRSKEASAKLLIDKVEAKNVNPHIRNLLIVDWYNVLNLMFLRHVEGASEILQKIDFIDDLIAFAQHGIAGKEEELIRLVSEYEDGLKMVAYNLKEMKDKVNHLEALLRIIADLEVSENAKEIPSSNIFSLEEVRNKRTELFNVIDDSFMNAELNEKFDQIEDEYYLRAKGLKTGTWLNFKKIANKSIRAKLSWISPLSHKYLFVNSRGIKITHKSCLDLAHGFRTREIQVIDSTIIFDQALFAISKKMQDGSEIVDLKTLSST